MADFCVLALNDCLMIQRLGSDRLIQFKPEDIKTRPNVPFYHMLWENEKKYVGQLVATLKREGKAGLVKPTYYVAVPDDTVTVDDRCIIDFFRLAQGRRCVLLDMGYLLAPYPKEYIAVLASGRSTVINYVKSGESLGIKYLEKKLPALELKMHIKYLHPNCEVQAPPIYLAGDVPAEYGTIGNLVSPAQMLANLGNVVERLKRSRGGLRDKGNINF